MSIQITNDSSIIVYDNAVVGPQGHQGVQGATGAQGFQGAVGAQGPAGGPQGPQGFQGAQGFQGLDGVQGAQGAQGSQGDVGAQGAQGATGIGTQGAQGFQGLDGVQGAQGAQGVQGATGVLGTASNVDITNTNGLATPYYITFVEDRTTAQIVRADVDLSYRTDTNTLTAINLAANNLIFADASVQKTAFAVATIKTTTNGSETTLSSVSGATNSITTIGNQLSLRVIYDDSSGTNANVQYQFATTRSVRGRSTLTTANAVTCAAVGGTPVTGSQWYSLGVLNNEADTLVATLGDESFHGLYRITFICRQLASNVASGYASIETLQTP
jgi:hypothetical protein